MRLGEILVRSGQLTEPQLQAALARQLEQRPRLRIGELLVRDGLIREDQCAAALAEQFGLRHLLRLAPESLDPQLVRTLPVEWARSRLMLPVRLPEGPAVALAEPEALVHLAELSLLVGQDLTPVLVSRAELLKALDACYMQGATASSSEAAVDADEAAALPAAEDLLRAADQAPVTQRVNRLLLDAVRQRASDIHVEPFRDRLSIRFRVDGFLYEQQPAPPKSMEAALISRLKIMAKLDIAERRLPQDGMATVRVGERAVDIRVSTVPVAEGERMVLRLLNREATTRSLGELGMPEGVWAGFRRVLREPSGIVLVTGPTGSGKTTTLYAALRELDTARLNVMTIEDPIEYQLDGIGQIQVKPKIGLTFANGLRHILRQDPDVILVGEIRDLETAEIAVRASLTGHLVFATLHTNDAASAVIRLRDMGVEPYLVGAALRGVLAQRLVRQLCPQCRRLAPATAEERASWGSLGARIGDRPVGHAVGCPACLGGYFGRTGVYEWLPMNDELRESVRDIPSASLLRQRAAGHGLIALAEDGLARILAGLTTPAEVLRAVGSGDDT
jgi:general secretion pathway protein E